MKIGVPSEIKAQESRVGLTPQSVKELVKDKHTVLIQKDAGIGAGLNLPPNVSRTYIFATRFAVSCVL